MGKLRGFMEFDKLEEYTLDPKKRIKNYKEFAKNVCKEIKIKPISFEVFSDDFSEMEKQAFEISSWAQNVYVKIPITNTKKESSIPLIKNLSKKNIKLNITAIMTLDQVKLSYTVTMVHNLIYQV